MPRVLPRKRRKVAEKLVLSAILVAGGCASDHRVSPWGERDSPALGPYVPAPDLQAQLGKVDAETAQLGMRMTQEIRRDLPRAEGPLVLRGYAGVDAIGRPTHAVRAATSRGVVMALGPLDARDPRDRATELVPALVEGAAEEGGKIRGAYASGTDLNGDGAADVVLRAETGALEIWRLTAISSVRYDVLLEETPTRAVDVDGDGRLDLVGEVAVAPDDPIRPRLEDVATFDGARYSHAAAPARAYHARRAAELEADSRPAPPTAPDAGPPPPPPDELRLRRALERAWHRLLAGEPRARVLAELDREPVPAALRSAFEAHRRRAGRL